MKNIYITGFMGTGKTSVGKILSASLNRPFVETDDAIVQKVGKKITDIFVQEGEAYFRRQERNILNEISSQNNLVVSCGGGLICNEDNLKTLKETGVVFNLDAPAKTIYERTKEHTDRPLLNVPNPLGKIKDLLKKRIKYYNQAHYSINTAKMKPREVADKIIEILNKTNDG